MEKRKRGSGKWGGRERASALTGLQCSPDPPGFICVHNSFSFCLSPALSLSHFHSFFAPRCVSNTHAHALQPAAQQTTIQMHVTIKLSCCFWTEMVHPRPWLCHSYLFHSKKDKRTASCSTKLLLAPEQADVGRTEDTTDSKESSFNTQLWTFSDETTKKTTLQPVKVITKRSLDQNVVSRLLISSHCHVTPLTPQPPTQQNRLKSHSYDHRGSSQQFKSQMESLVIVAS